MARATAAVRRELRASARRVPDVFAAGTRLVVGYSGGQDSTCLVHALLAAQPGLEVLPVHVDHALRRDSADDAVRVAAAGATLGTCVQVVRVDVAAYRAARPGWTVQQAARAARYHALGHVARQRGAAAILVGHTADDQAETLLLHLLRGAGLGGLSGMRLEQTLKPGDLGPAPADIAAGGDVRLVRPLLAITRAVTLAYCAELGLPLVEDASNTSMAYTRNRVRHDLLPALERFNPAIRAVLARTAHQAADDVAALDALVAGLNARLLRTAAPGLLTYDRHAWRAEPRALQRRLLRGALAALVGGLVDIRASTVEDALDLVQSGTPGQAYHLPFGVELRLASAVFVVDGHGRATPRKTGESNSRGYNACTREGSTTHGHEVAQK